MPDKSIHQHVDFISKLSSAIEQNYNSAIFIDGYTLSKHELVLIFQKNELILTIKLVAKFQDGFLIFGNEPLHKGSNAQSLFNVLTQSSICQVIQHKNNRSFELLFNNMFQLVFKCYAGLINVILIHNNKVIEVFRTEIKNDLNFKLNNINQVGLHENKEVLCSSVFFVYKNEPNNKIILTLTERPYTLLFKTNNALEASSVHAKYALNNLNFTHVKNSLLNKTDGEIKNLQHKIGQAAQALNQIVNQSTLSQLGDIIMANLYHIKSGATEVNLFNFYTNVNQLIKLKPSLSAVDNAQLFYKKAKNKNIEIEQLQLKISQQQLHLDNLLLLKIQINEATHLKQLLPFYKKQITKEHFPFKQFEAFGFQIWVGKNAVNNDLLTQKYAHKNDMWLHAKDVSGSHVIIKHQANKPFHQQIITYAAQLAAYYSKLKGNTLSAVSYTLKKFVRKPKGAHPGMVVVDKELVVLVPPINPATLKQ